MFPRSPSFLLLFVDGAVSVLPRLGNLGGSIDLPLVSCLWRDELPRFSLSDENDAPDTGDDDSELKARRAVFRAVRFCARETSSLSPSGVALLAIRAIAWVERLEVGW